jgi:hypothetical protein
MNGFAYEVPNHATGKHTCDIDQIHHQPGWHADTDREQRNIDRFDILDIKQDDDGGDDNNDGDIKKSHAMLPKWTIISIYSGQSI